MVYVVIGYSGEWSSLDVWVAGVYDERDAAKAAAEEQKAEDRANWVVWKLWNDAFQRRGLEAGMWWDYKVNSWDDLSRSDAGIALGIGPEPSHGVDDSEYTVSCVPMNQRGVWGYG